MDWNRFLLTTARCIDDPEWWRCIQMHWDAFVTAWREIWCRASSPWPLLRLPKLISTTPWIPNIAKTDIHSTECFCRCSPKFRCNAFNHICWSQICSYPYSLGFKYIHPEISLYSATYIAKRFRGSSTSQYMLNICHLSSSPDTKRDSLLIFESTPFTEKVLWNCESNWWINR